MPFSMTSIPSKIMFVVLVTLVVVGAGFHLIPHRFDRAQWRDDVVTTRASIQQDLAHATTRLQMDGVLTPENEILFAQRLANASARFETLILRAEHASAATDLEPVDHETIKELKFKKRIFALVERLHRARAVIADTDRRMSVVTVQADPGHVDPLDQFWSDARPWMDGELTSLRAAHETTIATRMYASAEPPDAIQTVLAALNSDLERLTQAALDLEIRRVDVWVDWATRQPRSRLPSMKQIATEQVAHLESLSTAAEALRLPPDPRLSSLHRDLRRMASVSSPTNWE